MSHVQDKLEIDNFNIFAKYPSIERTDRSKELDRVLLSNRSQEIWVATEKVHGANFSFVTNGIDVKCCKRTGELKMTSNFYNFQHILKDLRPVLIQVFEFCRDNLNSIQSRNVEEKEEIREYDFSDINAVRVYGEFFGGFYDHDDVKVPDGIRHVQKGVYYSPVINFYAFDLKVGGKYLSYKLACEVFEACGLMYNLPVQTGTLRELLEFDVETFESTIPEILGLPLIENNIAEGVVIRMYNRPNHDLFKLKAEAFHEKTSGKGQAKSRQPKKQKPREIKNEKVYALQKELETYINVMRLSSVLSKEEEITDFRELKPLIGLLAKDALEDFHKDCEEQLAELTQKEVKQVKTVAGRYAKELIDTFAEDILNHEL